MITEKTLDIYDQWLRARAEGHPEIRTKYLSNHEAQMLRTFSKTVSVYNEKSMNKWLNNAKLAESTKHQYRYAIQRFLEFVQSDAVKWYVCTLSDPPCVHGAVDLICCRDCVNFADCADHCKNEPRACGCSMPKRSVPPEAGSDMMPKQKHTYVRATPEKVAFIMAHYDHMTMSTMRSVTGLSRSTIQNVIAKFKETIN